jgi:hypothetical protein
MPDFARQLREIDELRDALELDGDVAELFLQSFDKVRGSVKEQPEGPELLVVFRQTRTLHVAVTELLAARDSGAMSMNDTEGSKVVTLRKRLGKFYGEVVWECFAAGFTLDDVSGAPEPCLERKKPDTGCQS